MAVAVAVAVGYGCALLMLCLWLWVCFYCAELKTALQSEVSRSRTATDSEVLAVRSALSAAQQQCTQLTTQLEQMQTEHRQALAAKDSQMVKRLVLVRERRGGDGMGWDGMGCDVM